MCLTRVIHCLMICLVVVKVTAMDVSPVNTTSVHLTVTTQPNTNLSLISVWCHESNTCGGEQLLRLAD